MKKLSLPILLLTAFMVVGCNTPNPGPRKYGFYELKDDVDESTLHGSPWLDTSIIGMANKVKKPSVKDDFFTSANYDVLTTNTIPEGSSKGGGLLYGTVKLVDDRIAGIMQSNQTFNALRELVKTGDKVAVKAEADAIINMSETEFADGLLNNVELVRGSSALFSIKNDKGIPSLDFSDDTKNMSLLLVATMYLMSPSIEQFPVVLADVAEACGYERSEAEALVQGAFGILGGFVQAIFNATKEIKVVKVKDLDSNFPSCIGIRKIVKDLGMSDEDDICITDIADKIAATIQNLCTGENFMKLKQCIALCKMFENRFFIGAEGVKDLYANKFAGTLLADSKISSNSSVDEVTNYVTDIIFPQVVERNYCEQYITPSAREKTKTIIEEVIGGFTEVLENNDWLSEATKEKALEKIGAMEYEAFYSDEYEAYHSFTYNPADLLTTYDNYCNYYLEGVFANAFTTDALHTGMPVTTVNAAYLPSTNSFRIFHGIVASFIDDELTKEQLYGRIGVVIGHEITHGFDSTGSKYDKDGNVEDWWTEEDAQAFDTKITKMINYYENNLSILNDGTKMVGSYLTGEIIADMGGMKTLIELGKKIDDFNWDEFFRNDAMFYNFSYTEAAVKDAVKNDPHPIGYLRVNATMAQFDEFLETYGITSGDGMYIAPEDRVAIW